MAEIVGTHFGDYTFVGGGYGNVTAQSFVHAVNGETAADFIKVGQLPAGAKVIGCILSSDVAVGAATSTVQVYLRDVGATGVGTSKLISTPTVAADAVLDNVNYILPYQWRAGAVATAAKSEAEVVVDVNTAALLATGVEFAVTVLFINEGV